MRSARIATVVLCCAAVAACATPPSGAAPRSPSQVKQQELEQMETQGQRNDIDKPFKK
jgi:hypothetical protein